MWFWPAHVKSLGTHSSRILDIWFFIYVDGRVQPPYNYQKTVLSVSVSFKQPQNRMMWKYEDSFLLGNPSLGARGEGGVGKTKILCPHVWCVCMCIWGGMVVFWKGGWSHAGRVSSDSWRRGAPLSCLKQWEIGKKTKVCRCVDANVSFLSCALSVFPNFSRYKQMDSGGRG